MLPFKKDPKKAFALITTVPSKAICPKSVVFNIFLLEINSYINTKLLKKLNASKYLKKMLILSFFRNAYTVKNMK
ncbi:hypothetical protein SDC9_154943 [bioreactor metagenome]|uniref:Uncharacterized protein n=1 Tax=bioreactor metagenome TaxID=1076179 RepID=A0A645F2D3_9ZZZZ